MLFKPGKHLNISATLCLVAGQIFSMASGKSSKYYLFLKKYERKTDSKLNSYIDF